MKAKFKVTDEFRLKKDQTFTRAFPMGGYNKDGAVGEVDKARRRAGSIATVSQIYETSVDVAEPSYDVDFGDFKVHVSETTLRELFDTV
jgi:hypothetical protein